MQKEIKVCRILKLRDDTDIIRNNLIYYYNIGIKDQFIMLHKPTEELKKILNTCIKELPDANFYFLHWDIEGIGADPINEEYLRILTDKAQKCGFNWIVGSDSDEFLILKRHKTIQEFIAQYDDNEIISLIFKWANYFLLRDNDECAPFYNNTVGPNFLSWTKSIGKFNKDMYFVQGLHHIGNYIYGQVKPPLQVIDIEINDAFFAHFPYRSKKQFVQKNKVQAEKFGGWRKKELDNDPLYFDKLFDTFVQNNSWPENLDKQININLKTNNIYESIDTTLMEVIKK
jgi:hypothetical protein